MLDGRRLDGCSREREAMSRDPNLNIVGAMVLNSASLGACLGLSGAGDHGGGGDPHEGGEHICPPPLGRQPHISGLTGEPASGFIRE